MKHPNLYLALLITYSFSTYIFSADPDAATESLLTEEFGLSGSTFSNQIYQRYYFIKRLEPCIAVLKQLNKILILKNNETLRKKLFGSEYFHTEKDHTIATTIDQMNDQQTLTPLFKLWDAFTHYQRISDSAYTQEFIWELFFITRNLLKLFSKDERSTDKQTHHILPLTTAKLCAAINSQTEQLHTYIPDAVKQTKKQLLQSCPSPGEMPLETRMEETDVHIDQILMRFYLLQRLRSSQKLLATFCHHSLPPTLFTYRHDGDDLIVNDTVRFSTSVVKNCIERMQEQQKVLPLCHLLEQFNAYIGVRNEDFSRETLLLICTVYRNILVLGIQQGKQPKSGIANGMLHMYSNASSFSLEEILDLINVFAEEIPSFLGKFDFYSKMKWKNWVKRYWWVPPLAILGAGLRIYFIHRRHQAGGGWFSFFGGSTTNNNNQPPPPPSCASHYATSNASFSSQRPMMYGYKPQDSSATNNSFADDRQAYGTWDMNADCSLDDMSPPKNRHRVHQRRNTCSKEGNGHRGAGIRHDHSRQNAPLCAQKERSTRNAPYKEAFNGSIHQLPRPYLHPNDAEIRNRQRLFRRQHSRTPVPMSHYTPPLKYAPRTRSDTAEKINEKREFGYTSFNLHDLAHSEQPPSLTQPHRPLMSERPRANFANQPSTYATRKMQSKSTHKEPLPRRSPRYTPKINDLSVEHWHDEIEQARLEHNPHSEVFGDIAESEKHSSADEKKLTPVQPPHQSAFSPVPPQIALGNTHRKRSQAGWYDDGEDVFEGAHSLEGSTDSITLQSTPDSQMKKDVELKPDKEHR